MKILKLFFSIFFLFGFTGCLYQTEISSTLIVDVIGLDYQDDSYQVFLSPYAGEKTETEVLEGKGDTLATALQSIEKNKNKRLFLLQCNTLILGSGIYNDQLKETLSYFNQSKKYNLNMSLYLAETLPPIFALGDLKNINFNEFNKIISNLSPSQEGQNKLFDYLKILYNETNIYPIPFIQKDTEKNNQAMLLGGIVFSQNQPVTKLDNAQMSYLDLLSSTLQNQVISLPYEEHFLELWVDTATTKTEKQQQYHIFLTGEVRSNHQKNNPHTLKLVLQRLEEEIQKTLVQISPTQGRDVQVTVSFQPNE